MEQLNKKILEIQDLIKKIGTTALPIIKLPKPITPIKPIDITSSKPSLAPTSQKDPLKVAQQIPDPGMKQIAKEVIKTDKNGQWKLDKV